MSLFRKPKKPAQRRVFSAVDDEEPDEPMETEGSVAPPAPRIRDKKKEKEGKEKSVKQTLLSFADEEEEEAEVFRVKKSSQSKRLARAREKQRRRAVEPHVTNSRDNTHNDKSSPEPEKPPETEKKSRSVEGLILSGRAALAADAHGDVEDEEEVTHDDAGFHSYRPESVRAALTKGQIPDAALIHAARKTRQQARQTGSDYIPLANASENRDVGVGSRLVREDGSGDEEEEERLAVRGIISQREKYNNAKEASGADSGGEEWEAQQLQKAVPGAVPGSAQSTELSDGMELNLFSVAPPAPCLSDAPAHLRPLTVPQAEEEVAPQNISDLLTALRQRMSTLRVARENTAAGTTELRSRLLGAMRTRETRASRAPDLDAAYRRAQSARSYFVDLVECIDEKMPQLESLEARALQLHRRRSEFLAERRRADVRDQAQDVLALAARPGAQRAPDSEEKIRRAAEREGRRRARRLAREQAAPALAAQHREGDSSDDEVPHGEREHARSERETMSALAAQLFGDALPAWGSVRGVCARLSRWRRDDPQAYNDAYVADCLPRILAPYVRAEIVLWNPLADADNEDYEKMDWYKCLMMYGVRHERLAHDSEASDEDVDGLQDNGLREEVTEESVREDPDLMLVPNIVARVLLPKITELVEHAWDPMCVRATTRLRAILLKSAALPPRECAPRVRLAAEIRAKLLGALSADVFLPALPQPIMDGKGGQYWRRCLGAGVRLLRAVLSLCPPPAVLNADAIALRLIGTLCTAAGAAPPQAAAHAASALASSLPCAQCRLRRAALQRLAALAAATVQRLQTDNPMHFKALEQVRTVLAEAESSGVAATA